MADFYIAVNPVLIYPECLQSGKEQNCFDCGLYGRCPSSRSLCVQPYPGHKKGCPNYGVKPGCPPGAPLFDRVFDMQRQVYAIYSIFDLGAHVRKMRSRHPGWTQRQLHNARFWQGTAGKALRMNIGKFSALYKKDGYYATIVPEAMGVDVTQTMKNAGIILEWPAENTIYKIAVAGILKDQKYAHLLL